MISLTAVKTSWISAWTGLNRVVRIGAGFGLMPGSCSFFMRPARQDGAGPYIEGTGAEGPQGKGDAFCMGEDGGWLAMRGLLLGEGTPRCPRARRSKSLRE